MSTVLISVRSIGCKPVDVDVSPDVQVSELRAIIGEKLAFPLDRLKLVREGRPLLDKDGRASLQHGDSLLAILAPKAPPQYLQDLQEPTDGAGEFNDPARFRLPANASPAKQRLVAFLRGRLRLPDVALVVLFGVRPWVWVAIVMWLICAPIAHRMEVGPMYVLITIVAVIFGNLGTRAQGEQSAYSIFNNFRELPGQLNAGRLDEQLRRGQM